MCKKLLTLQTIEPSANAYPSTGDRCVSHQGFSLHANTYCAPTDRQKLERLCRYITRPALANERIKIRQNGDVVLKLKSPYKDGTTHIVMTALEFLQKLAALVPRPRLNLIRVLVCWLPTPNYVHWSCHVNRTLNRVTILNRTNWLQSQSNTFPGPDYSNACLTSTFRPVPIARAISRS